jgi:hypothetical protein
MLEEKQQWEYKIKSTDGYNIKEHLMGLLEEYGKEGWELVTKTKITRWLGEKNETRLESNHFIFKRPKQD